MEDDEGSNEIVDLFKGLVMLTVILASIIDWLLYGL